MILCRCISIGCALHVEHIKNIACYSAYYTIKIISSSQVPVNIEKSRNKKYI